MCGRDDWDSSRSCASTLTSSMWTWKSIVGSKQDPGTSSDFLNPIDPQRESRATAPILTLQNGDTDPPPLHTDRRVASGGPPHNARPPRHTSCITERRVGHLRLVAQLRQPRPHVDVLRMTIPRRRSVGRSQNDARCEDRRLFRCARSA
jgi:hypothetical protein